MSAHDPAATPFGQIDPSDIQAGSSHPVQATVGQPFPVTIPNAALNDDPGSSWFASYDQYLLTLLQSGWNVSSDGTSLTWAVFLPNKAGTTVVQGVIQPHKINPLFQQYNFEVTITS